MLRTLSVCTLIALIAAPALGHGGRYQPPSDAGSPFGTDGGHSGPPTNPNGRNAAGPNGSNATSGLSVTRGDSPRTGNQRGGHGSTTGSIDGLAAHGVWEYWWDHNKAALLDVRSRLSGGGTVSFGSKHLTGHGRNSRLLPTRAVTEEMVVQEVFPLLRAVLAETDERDLLDSAVLAMARSVRAGQVDEALAAAQALLAHRELSVQTSATLSLGVLASPRAVPMLQDLAVGTSAGRVLVGGKPVPALVRAFAALSLGMLDTPAAVPTLMGLARDTPDSERNLRACSVIGLGLSREAAGPEVVNLLVSMLEDRRIDSVVKSFVPTSLGKLGDTRALPALMNAFTHRDTHIFVSESIAIALGRLGSVDHPEVIDALKACHEQARDMSTRQFALMSLAFIAAQQDIPETARGTHDELMSWLADQVSQPARRVDRPWAALAAGIAARNHSAKQGPIIDRLADGYEEVKDPSVKAAFALALGLLESRAHGPTIFADFQSVSDPVFKGYAAIALGLINHDAARDRMRAMCGNRNNTPSLRQALATGLALMRDTKTVPLLVATLKDAETLGLISAVAQSLGLIGDADALRPLGQTVADKDLPPLSRAFAVVSLGLLAERTRLPWHAAIRADNNYLIDIPPMSEVFDIP